MKIKNYEWTKPYYGISHLKNIKKEFQITISGIGDKTLEGYILSLNSGSPFTPFFRKFSKNLKYLKTVLQNKAKNLGIYE